MKPYYDDGKGIVIYHADCREVVPDIGAVDCVITDPPYGQTSLKWDRWVPEFPELASQVAKSMWCFGSLRMFVDHWCDFKDWRMAQDLVWEKHNGSNSSDDRFRRIHESIVHFYTETGKLFSRAQYSPWMRLSAQHAEKEDRLTGE